MTTADGRGKSHRDTLLPIILCLCFYRQYYFLVQMILKSQKRTWHTCMMLRTRQGHPFKTDRGRLADAGGLAVSLRELVILDENQILTILNDINEEMPLSVWVTRILTVMHAWWIWKAMWKRLI